MYPLPEFKPNDIVIVSSSRGLPIITTIKECRILITNKYIHTYVWEYTTNWNDHLYYSENILHYNTYNLENFDTLIKK